MFRVWTRESISYLPCKAVSGCPTMILMTTRHPQTDSNKKTVVVVSHKENFFQFWWMRNHSQYNINVYLRHYYGGDDYDNASKYYIKS